MLDLIIFNFLLAFKTIIPHILTDKMLPYFTQQTSCGMKDKDIMTN